MQNDKDFHPNSEQTKKQTNLKVIERIYLRRLIGLITEQNNLNYFQKKLYPHDISEMGRFCKEENKNFGSSSGRVPGLLS